MFKNWTPQKLFETACGYWPVSVLQSAVKLGVFNLLDKKFSRPSEISKKLKLNPQGTETFLNALSAMHLLEKKNSKFKNTKFSTTYLSSNSHLYLGHIILHHKFLTKYWVRLDAALKDSFSLKSSPHIFRGKDKENFLMGMFNIGRFTARKIASKVSLRGRKKLLDLGSGPGTYSIYFCLKNPQLSAEALDLPGTEKYFKELVKRFNLEKRITFIPGDYFKTNLSSQYDVVFISHIIHSLSERMAFKLIKRATSFLKKDGLFILHDFILDDQKNKPLFCALFSLNMFLATKSGHSYSQSEIKNLLKKAGIRKLRHISLGEDTPSSLILGQFQ